MCIFITSAERRRLFFHLCWFVCFLFVGGKHYGNTRERIFIKFSGKVGQDTRYNLEILGVSCLTPWVLFFSVLSRKFVSVSKYYGKTDERIFMNFSEKVGHQTRDDLEHFRDIAVNPLNPGLIFFYFLDPCLLVMLCENGQRIFMKLSWNVNDDPWNNNDWLDCFTAPYIGAAACLLATLQQNGWVDFHEIFRIGWLWHKEQSFWGCSF